MDNRSFVSIHALAQGRAKRHGNLFTDEAGTLFSYGYHYPLLFRIETPQGVFVCRNTRGYSVTTAKHISLCQGKQNFDVKLPGSDYSAEAVKKALMDEASDLVKKIGALSSRAWKQRETLQNRLDDITKAFEVFGW